MNKILVTGPTSFLGYHVVKKLNERGLRPYVLVPIQSEPSASDVLKHLDVEVIVGNFDNIVSLQSACTGIDTVLHLGFLVSVGGGAEEHMRQSNVIGTRNLVQAAAQAKVTRIVVTSSVLAVGVNREKYPLDESADWKQHRFSFPYAEIRREAEQAALAMASPELSVITVCPSFTLGPDDYASAPANKLIKAIIAGKLPIKVQVGFGCLDVRDFADGMLRVAEHGRSGQRYILNSHNVMIDDFLEQAAWIAGTKPPSWTLPAWLANLLVATIEFMSKLKGKPSPLTRSVLQIINRYAWYDATRARTELGWKPRPLADTLTDTIAWLRLHNE
jgi:dihydroflavonol-4-reductase